MPPTGLPIITFFGEIFSILLLISNKNYNDKLTGPSNDLSNKMAK
jgi:hypothetical protein